MSRERNLATVGAVYAAFGAGDIPAVLRHLDAGVEWCNAGPTDISYFGTKHGHDGALSVFGFLGANMDITAFDPHTIVGDEEHVVALVHVAATVKGTGRSYDEETVHVFDFGTDGRIVRFRDYQDTAAVASALRS